MKETERKERTMQTSREQRLDDFWDIEQLIPARSQKTPSVRASRHIEAVDIELDAPSEQSSASRLGDQGRIPDRHDGALASSLPQKEKNQRESDLVYVPDHPLISKVRLYSWRGGFPFYQRFCQTAQRLFDQHGDACEPVPFFSYMPQYDQMNRAQLAWYLYWRDQVRDGVYLQTDYSYIFLYLFEIINLPSQIPPSIGQRLLCEIWQKYRREYPVLNRYLADWICDYSLIHQLPPPTKALAHDLRLIAEQSTLKEFYAYPTGEKTLDDAHIYMLFCSNYTYSKSKVYQAGANQAALMDKHIPLAISFALQGMKQQNRSFASTPMQKARVCRDSFVGALCSSEMKRRIEVEYCSFHRSHELRFLITDMIKYAENKIRATLGVKSKLNIYALPPEIRSLLDEYFSQALPSGRSSRPTVEPRPAYERLYDLPNAPISAERAARIEQASWDVTQRLVEAFESESQETEADLEQDGSAALPIVENTTGDQDDPTASLRPYRDFLLAAYEGDGKRQRELAAHQGLLTDALAEEINNVAVDVCGDILLEQGENGTYRIIEDYLDDIKPMLLQQGGSEHGNN